MLRGRTLVACCQRGSLLLLLRCFWVVLVAVLLLLVLRAGWAFLSFSRVWHRRGEMRCVLHGH
jgi:hypothetical protein